MTQGAQPVIHGAEWTPSEALTFTQPLLIDAAEPKLCGFSQSDTKGMFSLLQTFGII